MKTASQLAAAVDDVADIRRLHEICMPRSKGQADLQLLHQGAHGYATATRHSLDSKWVQVLRQLHLTLRSRGEGSPLDNIFHPEREPRTFEKGFIKVLQAVAAILYDQELCGSVDPVGEATRTEFNNAVPEDGVVLLTPVVPALFEHMLLVDYGIETRPLRPPPYTPSWLFRRLLWPSLNGYCEYLVEFATCCKRGQLPDAMGWEYLRSRLVAFRPSDPADMALMLYYYHTHRQPLDRADYEKCLTGYTGVLDELVAEVPTQGTERLLRKLSLDLNELIPHYVGEPSHRQRMILTAKSIAAQHGLCIHTPDFDGASLLILEPADAEIHRGKDSGGLVSRLSIRPWRSPPEKVKLKLD